jgi:hypothetical protein
MVSYAPIVGSWNLASVSYQDAGGHTEYPYGQNPSGLLIYGVDDTVSVQIMSGERSASLLSASQVALASLAHLRSLLAGYYSYAGTYQVNEAAQLITHHVSISLWPGQVGTDLIRHFTIRGGELQLRSEPTIAGHDRRIVLMRWCR